MQDARDEGFVPVVAIDDVEDDENERVDGAESGETRHRDEQRRRDANDHVVTSRRPALLHAGRERCHHAPI